MSQDVENQWGAVELPVLRRPQQQALPASAAPGPAPTAAPAAQAPVESLAARLEAFHTESSAMIQNISRSASFEDRIWMALQIVVASEHARIDVRTGGTLAAGQWNELMQTAQTRARDMLPERQLRPGGWKEQVVVCQQIAVIASQYSADGANAIAQMPQLQQASISGWSEASARFPS